LNQRNYERVNQFDVSSLKGAVHALSCDAEGPDWPGPTVCGLGGFEAAGGVCSRDSPLSYCGSRPVRIIGFFVKQLVSAQPKRTRQRWCVFWATTVSLLDGVDVACAHAAHGFDVGIGAAGRIPVLFDLWS